MTSSSRSEEKHGQTEAVRQNSGPLQRQSLFKLLDADHHRIMELFETIQGMDNSARNRTLQLFSSLEEELKTHLEGEERFFYTVLESFDDTVGKVLESYEEHLILKTIIGSFNSLAWDDKRWGAKLKVLRKMFEFHVREEEELLREAKRLLSGEQERNISGQLLDLKRKGGSMRSLGEPAADI